MKTAAAPAVNLKTAFQESVRNLLILDPKIRAIHAAERLIQESQKSEPELLSALTRSLLMNHFMNLVKVERLAEAKERKKTEPLLPGFEHLPMRIPTQDGHKILLAKARYSDLKGYLSVLNRNHRDRQKNDAKIIEAKGLMKVMAKYIRKQRGITYAEVAVLEAARRR